uniref:Multiple epidermal growth factor-like domains protein 10 isoform X2 n=1 Tax=Crassostrea virginica TaxID=6565 RepID=A0A8B8BPT7_CRAVI|nr:multiple epidermal growth factor-like domains protein 10 isoform X2 [Crassostrea virginica]
MYAVVLLVCLSWVALLCFSVKAYENLALHQPAWQSSTLTRLILHLRLISTADLAVDGSTPTCALSRSERTAEWWVDLGGVKNIHHVLIQHEKDKYKFLGFSVYISNTTDIEDGVVCFRDTNYTRATIPNPVNITCPHHGRYVIYYNNRTHPPYPEGYSSKTSINLCEVEVYGCDVYTYGLDCKRCGNCSGGVQCDHVTGTCPNGCDPGMNGDECDRECGNKTYGMECKEQCGNCSNGEPCHHVDGRCPSGCNAGAYGLTCKESCGNCRNGEPCNDVDGSCPSGCNAGGYGVTCKEYCGNCSNGEPCHQVDGTCPHGCDAGIYGDKWDKECDNNTYGMECKKLCGNCSNGDPCHHVDGTCANGCDTGIYGEKCDKECSNNTYGVECKELCGKCSNWEPCHHEDGSCPSGCNAGAYGVTCKESCGNCSNGEPCNDVDGSCRYGCDVGVHGKTCDEACQPGRYGINCAKPCGPKCQGCNRFTGVCEFGCLPGWTGPSCEKRKATKSRKQKKDVPKSRGNSHKAYVSITGSGESRDMHSFSTLSLPKVPFYLFTVF